jgi:hypothetical protein
LSGLTLGLFAVAALGPLSPPAASPKSTEAGFASMAGDTLRPRAGVRATEHGRVELTTSGAIEGYLSARGLPPVAGNFIVTDSGLVFHSADGRRLSVYPLIGPLRETAGRQWRAATVSLASADRVGARTVYLFRVAGGVFETEAPGTLLEVAQHPAWLDSLRSMEWVTPRLIVSGDESASWSAARQIASTSYADSLYTLFGRPLRSIGLVGQRGRSAARLGEYVASRDSVALDPARMTGDEQLRHALAHELGHRWQVRAPRQLATLWQGVPPILDPKRYGYGSIAEHQAEAIAFAIHFLQTTADPQAGAASLSLLDHYERLVPGTSVIVHYFSLQPIYANHPLRRLLTLGRTQ